MAEYRGFLGTRALVGGGAGLALDCGAGFGQVASTGFCMGSILRGAGGLGFGFDAREGCANGAQFRAGIYRCVDWLSASA